MTTPEHSQHPLESHVPELTKKTIRVLEDIRKRFLQHLDQFQIRLVLKAHPNLDGTFTTSLKEVKFRWKRIPDFSTERAAVREILFKYKELSTVLDSSTLTEFISLLEVFHRHYLELEAPWEVIEWRCYFSVTHDKLRWYDNTQGHVDDVPLPKDRPASDYLALLAPRVNERARQQLRATFLKDWTRLVETLHVLVPALEFRHVLDGLRQRVTTEILSPLEREWKQRVENPTPTLTDLLVMGFILRHAIEMTLRQQHRQQLSDLRQSLGHLFRQLQQEHGMYVKEKSDIQQHLDLLNALVHGNASLVTANHDQLISLKTKILAAKKFFERLFQEHRVSFVVLGDQ